MDSTTERVEVQATHDGPTGENESNSTPFAIGDRIEVYWTKEKRWYAGVVVALGKQKHKKQGLTLEAPSIQVKYDDGHTLTHSMHNNDMRHEEQDQLPSLFLIQSSRQERLLVRML